MPEEALRERFVKIIEIDDEVVSIQEGTLHEIAIQRQEPEPNTAPVVLGASKADEIIKVAKFVWDIVKDSKAEAATEAAITRVLSAKGDKWENYGDAKNMDCKEVTYKLDNVVGVNCYMLKFRVAGTYRAKHPDIGGLWIPNAHITFSKCSATWPWTVNGGAIIDGTNISNMGSVKDPVPQLVLNVKIRSNAKIGLNVESHEETFEFLLNADDGARPV